MSFDRIGDCGERGVDRINKIDRIGDGAVLTGLTRLTGLGI